MEGSELEGAKNAAAERKKLGWAGLPASSMKPKTICFVQKGLIGEISTLAPENFEDFSENSPVAWPAFPTLRSIRAG